MRGNIPILALHDLAVAYRNKTFILLLCIPLFVYGTMAFVDRKDASSAVTVLAVVETRPPREDMMTALRSVPEVFSLRMVKTAEEGRNLIKNGNVDGMLGADENEPSRVLLTVLKEESVATLAISRAFLALRLAAGGIGADWISGIAGIQSVPAETQSLPTWIMMSVLLVALFVLPAQVAEEKEKQWLSALLQTPMTELEWLAAKLLFSGVLTLFSVAALQLLGGRFSLPWTYYVSVLLGGCCFNAVGLALGLLCRNQASARTFGVILYLPLLVPVALSDASAQFLKIAKWTPSFALYDPLQAVILYPGNSALFPGAWLFLFCLGSAACALSFFLIRIRWLMR